MSNNHTQQDKEARAPVKRSQPKLKRVVVGLALLLIGVALIVPVIINAAVVDYGNTAIWNTYDGTYSDPSDPSAAEFTVVANDELDIIAPTSVIGSSQDLYAAFYMSDVNGDFTAYVTVAGQEETAPDAMAGIMVRNEITSPGSSQGYCVVAVTPGNFVFAYDSDGNGVLDEFITAGGVPADTVYLMLQKTGNTFQGYYTETPPSSPTHPSWVPITASAVTIATANTSQDVGLFATNGSMDTSVDSCTVTFGEFDTDNTPPLATFTIDASVTNSNGIISPSGPQTITEGANQTFTVIPNYGYTPSIAVDGTPASLDANNKYTFSSVSANHSIEASFTAIEPVITTTVDANGTIDPSGSVNVSYGDDAVFTVTPVSGYTADTVTVDGTAVTLINDAYRFEDVTENHSISVTFVEDTTSTGGTGIAGCATDTSKDYSTGFLMEDFDSNNVTFSGGEMVLDTGNDAINPDSIVIPFEQEVAVTFLYEGAGYVSDFGWILKEDAVDSSGNFLGWNNIPEDKKHPVFINIRDDSTAPGGVLDSDYGDAETGFPYDDEAALAVFDDGTDKPDGTPNYFVVDGDGSVEPKDMKKVLGTFAAGTEIVFFLTANKAWNTTDTNGVFFTKTDWNPDTYTACEPVAGDDNWMYSGETTFHKDFYLGLALPSEGSCQVESPGWLSSTALSRLNTEFGVTLNTTDVYELPIYNHNTYPHVIVGAPENDPNQWILGWEDLTGGGDADFNDMVFRVERKTGGIATLEETNAIVPTEPNSYYTAVTFAVYDYMPSADPCDGMTDITYSVSIDGGENWVTITAWDTVLESDASKTQGAAVTDWTPGHPEYTYRTRRVDFSGLGLSGRALIWRAELESENEACQPKVIDVEINGSVSSHGSFARSSPTAKANVLYAGTFETLDASWTDKAMRGHLVATRIYDPVYPKYSAPDTTAADPAKLWDAGEVLSGETPTTRNIKIPNITVTPFVETIATGDGSETTFTGTLANGRIVAETLEITDTTETFTDRRTDELVGSLTGTGTINRFSGAYTLTFDTPPGNGVPIQATYSYYTVSTTLLDFSNVTTGNVTNAMLGMDNTWVNPGGYIYDFNGDGSITEADGDWLVDWVRGYNDGTGQSDPKEWLLGPVDHSVPALETPPGTPPWYFGTDVPPDERAAFDAFQTFYEGRDSVIFVGSRDGMLHAFDAGEYRHGNNPETDDEGIEEYRGYYLWEAVNTVTPVTDFDNWWVSLLALFGNPNPYGPPDFRWRITGMGATGDAAPNYGTGKELWAFIPANLISRLKNNYMGREDQAYVDASPALVDVYIDHDSNGSKEWRTLLICAQGNGGDTIFCLDVTDPATPQFLWEFGDPDLFRSRSSPAVAQVGRIVNGGESEWVAFFVSGKTEEAGLFPSVYMIDVENGSVVDRVFLTDDPAGIGAGGVPSGQPAVIDSDYNGYIDRVYVTTDKGYLYKIRLHDEPNSDPPDPSTPVRGHAVINTDFTADEMNDPVTGDPLDCGGADSCEVDPAQRYHPIYGSPVAVINNGFTGSGEIAYKIRLFFGTGDSPYYDENINTANTSYHFFAYIDEDSKDENGTNVTLNWFYELPEGQRVFASAFAAAGRIYFGTSAAETEDPCDTSGGTEVGRLYGFDYEGTKYIDQAEGNISTTVLVEDEHLYFITPEDGLQSLGSGNYNNAVITAGEPQTVIRWWKELDE